MAGGGAVAGARAIGAKKAGPGGGGVPNLARAGGGGVALCAAVSGPVCAPPSTTLLRSAPPVVDGRAKPHSYQDKAGLENDLAAQAVASPSWPGRALGRTHILVPRSD